MAKHVCPICEDVYAQPGTVVAIGDHGEQRHEAWHCPQCGYAFVSYHDAEKMSVAALRHAPKDSFRTELIKAGDGEVRRRT